MKNTMIFLAFLLPMVAAYAGSLNTPDAAVAVKKQIRGKVLKLEGVAGIGTPTCDPKTGKVSSEADAVFCVAIYVEDLETYENLIGLYPAGTKIKDVFVTIVTTGEFTSDPRMSTGN